MTAEGQDDYWADVPGGSAEDLAAVFGEPDPVLAVTDMQPVTPGRHIPRAEIAEIAAMYDHLRPMSRDERRAVMVELLTMHARPPRSSEPVRSCSGSAPQARARQPARRRTRRIAASSSDGCSAGEPPQQHLSALSVRS